MNYWLYSYEKVMSQLQHPGTEQNYWSKNKAKNKQNLGHCCVENINSLTCYDVTSAYMTYF